MASVKGVVREGGGDDGDDDGGAGAMDMAGYDDEYDEDDDGNAASKPAKQAAVDESQLLDYVSAIEAAPSSEELQRLYKEAYDLCKGNQTWQTRIIEAKKVRVERAKKEKTQ